MYIKYHNFVEPLAGGYVIFVILPGDPYKEYKYWTPTFSYITLLLYILYFDNFSHNFEGAVSNVILKPEIRENCLCLFGN